MSNHSPHHKRKADSISNNIDSEDNLESGYKVTFTWEHYPFPINSVNILFLKLFIYIECSCSYRNSALNTCIISKHL